MTKESNADPVIAFRIPVEINNEVDILKHHIMTQDGGAGRRTDVGRSLFAAILKRPIVDAIITLSRSRGEPFAHTLQHVVELGIEAAVKQK